MNMLARLALATAVSVAPGLASASAVTGGTGALRYTASSFIVGQTSTSLSVAGGNPIYFPDQPADSGVVTLLIRSPGAPTSVCTGALLSNRVSILTAGHCVSHGAGATGPISVTAYFPGAGGGPDTIVAGSPTSTAVAISRIRVDPLYTGQVIDQNDFAVLTLAGAAPTTAVGYGLYTGDPLGQDYTIAGYGAVSSAGGSAGANLPPGLLRQGTNTFDFMFGDSLFGGYFLPGGAGNSGTADDSKELLADFDDGTATNNTSCNLAAAFGGGGARFCDTGTGATEVGTAFGDSGAPEFINGQIAGVASFGLSFSGNAPNGKFGELDGSAPTAFQRNFILSVPEPSTWAMMIAGVGLIGGVGRGSRRRAEVTG